MRLRTFIVSVLAAASAASFAAEQSIVDGTLAVKVAAGNDKAATAALKRVGATVSRSFPEIGWKIVRLAKSAKTVATFDSLSKQTSFSKVELNRMDRIDETPNDPLISQQWGVNRMQLPDAWGLSHGDTSVVVAIVDTGIDRGHPDLTGRVLPGFDFVNNDSDPDDDQGHGTHCAGIAAASTNNGVGVAGAGYNVTILPVKAASAAGGLTYEWEAAGILYAANNGANVISMSFGGAGTSDLVNDALQYAYGRNIVLVAAAGNDNVTSLHYPAAYPNVIAVASSDPDDSRSGFSNYGPDWVHVAAPGNGILSTFPRSLTTGTPYIMESGTSMACPNVAGVAALLISYAGVDALTNTEIRNLLQDNADPVPGAYVEFGRINAYKSILQIGTKIGEEPIPSNPAAFEGSIVGTGTGEPIMSTDGLSLVLRSVKRGGIGLTGSVSTSFEMTQIKASELRGATLTLTASGDSVATLQVYFWNNLNGKWEIYATKPATTASKTTSYKLSNTALQKYMDGSILKVMIRSLVPTRLASKSSGITNIDQASVTFNGIRLPGAQP